MNAFTMFWVECEPLGTSVHQGRSAETPSELFVCFTHSSLASASRSPRSAHIPKPVIRNRGAEILQTSRSSMRFKPGRASITVSLLWDSSGIRTAWIGEEEKSSAELSQGQLFNALVLCSVLQGGDSFFHVEYPGNDYRVNQDSIHLGLGHPSFYLLSWCNY